MQFKSKMRQMRRKKKHGNAHKQRRKQTIRTVNMDREKKTNIIKLNAQKIQSMMKKKKNAWCMSILNEIHPHAWSKVLSRLWITFMCANALNHRRTCFPFDHSLTHSIAHSADLSYVSLLEVLQNIQPINCGESTIYYKQLRQFFMLMLMHN